MNSKSVQNKLECLSRVETRVTFRGHVPSTTCLQTLTRSVTSIKARWLEHQNTFGLGSSLSFKQTLTFPWRFESCLALMVEKSAAKLLESITSVSDRTLLLATFPAAAVHQQFNMSILTLSTRSGRKL